MSEQTYKVMLNGKKVEHSFKTGDRVHRKENRQDTGTVIGIYLNGISVEVDWDSHCADRLGKSWLPTSIALIEEVESLGYDGTKCVTCGFNQVEKYSDGARICEHCGWNQIDGDYEF